MPYRASIRISIVLFFLLLSSFSVGCGDSTSSPSPPPPTPSPPPAPPPAPEISFGPGQHLVGEDIAPGRYFSDPQEGCFWERQSGLGGTLDDTLANEFVGFDSLQEIVDIPESDVAFEADAECGTWFDSPRHGAQTEIQPGVWLVGDQVAPGTYRATAGDGCFWERLSGFTGNLEQTIANEFVSGGGQQLVSISPGDVGFSTDDDCGTWTRADTLSSLQTLEGIRAQSEEEIEHNWRLNREQELR